jgi:hypothetical protein
MQHIRDFGYDYNLVEWMQKNYMPHRGIGEFWWPTFFDEENKNEQDLIQSKALQIASDTIEINKEATEAGRRFEIDIPENTEISWDSADFSAFMLKLTKVRRALLLGMPMIGDLAFDLARIELHNQFDKKRRKKRKK